MTISFEVRLWHLMGSKPMCPTKRLLKPQRRRWGLSFPWTTKTGVRTMSQRPKAPKRMKPSQPARGAVSEPLKKPAPNKAKPPRPVKKQDVEDIERADSEGMAQPQATSAKRKTAAAVPPVRIAVTKRGREQAATLSPTKSRATVKKLATKRRK